MEIIRYLINAHKIDSAPFLLPFYALKNVCDYPDPIIFSGIIRTYTFYCKLIIH